LSLAPGARVELRIESLAAGGDGVAHLEGRALFVPLTAPGDRVLARVTQVRPRFARAQLERVLEPGPGRREPPCPYFGRCGGCSWLHLREDEQQRAREAILRDALTRLARLESLPPIEHVRSPRALGYRARARVAWDEAAVGFRARGSHRVIDIGRCAVLDAPTQLALEELRAHRPAGSGELSIRGFGERIEVAGRSYQVGPGSFFQANGSLWERWLEVVRELCGRGRLAVELYAGVGFYTVDLAAAFERVVAVESSSAACDLRHNSRVHVVKAPSETWAKRELRGLAPDLVLLNPPRVGCHPDVCDALAHSGAARVVYVSCEPSTLARDLARIGRGFRPSRLIVLDALPQTHHVEAIAVLDQVDPSEAPS
jgi:23S rRNA (uracil1939-C5)-methyltransferase